MLAAAAGTDPERVMVCAVHQHDAPVADLDAERIPARTPVKGNRVIRDFNEGRPARGQGLARCAPRRRSALPISDWVRRRLSVRNPPPLFMPDGFGAI